MDMDKSMDVWMDIHPSIHPRVKKLASYPWISPPTGKKHLQQFACDHLTVGPSNFPRPIMASIPL
jgi:hypothetical protein